MIQAWENRCKLFNDRTSVHKIWPIFKGMLGKRQATNACETFMLRYGIIKEQLAGMQGISISQPVIRTDSGEARNPLLPQHPRNSPFTVGKLVAADKLPR